ncbi:MAG: hypothetical protein WCR55_12810 [Lentisphaerota bacterium]
MERVFVNINKKQLYRLLKFVGELKENRYPNCKSFTEELNKVDIDDNVSINCSTKTIQRDIKLLKEYFKAPIEFNTEFNGFYLTNHGWDFNAPLYSEEELLASVLGAKFAQDLMPEPLKSEILAKAVEGPITSMISATALQLHPSCTVIVDEDAASLLTEKEYYRWIFQNEPQWEPYRESI